MSPIRARVVAWPAPLTPPEMKGSTGSGSAGSGPTTQLELHGRPVKPAYGSAGTTAIRFCTGRPPRWRPSATRR
jgi:hypothetical protein